MREMRIEEYDKWAEKIDKMSVEEKEYMLMKLVRKSDEKVIEEIMSETKEMM